MYRIYIYICVQFGDESLGFEARIWSAYLRQVKSQRNTAHGVHAANNTPAEKVSGVLPY